jgi:hypothetical protein
MRRKVGNKRKSKNHLHYLLGAKDPVSSIWQKDGQLTGQIRKVTNLEIE